MFHSKGKILLWLAALVTLLSLGLASKPLGLNARSISSEQTGGLMLNNQLTGTIVIEKQTDPPGGSGFDFTHDFGNGTLSFTLDDGASWTFDNVPAIEVSYTITETSPAPAFDLTDLTCEDPDQGSSIDLGAGAATIDLDAGETITCTFTNTQRGTIIVEKQTNPAGGTGFGFTDTITAPNSFSLGDGGTKTFINVVPDTYTVTEDDPTVTPSGFDLTGLTCVEDSTSNSTTDTVSRQATISLDAGETITCTFTNGQRDIIPVGGYVVSVNKLGLLAPWLGLAALASLAALTVALVSRRRG